MKFKFDVQEMKMYGNKILVKVLDDDKQTKLNVIIPNTVAENDYKFGVVLKVGMGAVAPQTGEKIPVETQPGNTILFSRTTAKYFEHEDGNTYAILADTSVIAYWSLM